MLKALLFVWSGVVGGRQGIANELLHGCYDVVGSNALLVRKLHFAVTNELLI